MTKLFSERSGRACLKLTLLLWCLAATPARAEHLVLEAADGHFVDAQINGTTLRLKVRLDHEAAVNINRSAAARAGLGRGSGAAVMQVGLVRIEGRSARADLIIAGRPVPARLHWYEADASDEADGEISAAILPYESITLRYGAPGGAERILSFRAGFHGNHGIHVPVRVGRRNIAVRFAPERPRTTAPASAGAVIAAELGGSLGGQTGQELIGLGVSRPVRILHLERPLEIGELSLSSLMVRAVDFRGNRSLPPVQQGEAEAEAEIVVTARPPSQRPLYRLTVGQDALGGCWAATYRHAERDLTFYC